MDLFYFRYLPKYSIKLNSDWRSISSYVAPEQERHNALVSRLLLPTRIIFAYLLAHTLKTHL